MLLSFSIPAFYCYTYRMDKKRLIWIFLFIGSTAGSYLPTLWGDGVLSATSIILSFMGGALGIWAGYKLGD